jgi:hypothetical protein
MKRPRGMSDADFLAALLDLRARGLPAATALGCVMAMDRIAAEVLAGRAVDVRRIVAYRPVDSA